MKKLFIFLFILLSFSVLYAQDLSVPVSINSNGATLSDVCEFLSQQTGLNIKAGKDENDWIVSDRRTIIHVENVPLKDLIDSICNVFDLKSEIKNDGILFYASKEQLDNQLKLRENYFAKEKENFINKQNLAFEALNTGVVSNNYTKLFYNSEYQKKFFELITKHPEFKELFINKESSLINFNKLNQEDKNLFISFILAYYEFYKAMQPDLLDSIDLLDNKEEIFIKINSNSALYDRDIYSDSIFSSLTIKTSKKIATLDILDPYGVYTDIIAQAMVKQKNGESRENISKFIEVSTLQFKINLILKDCTPCENLNGDIFNNVFNLHSITNRQEMSCRDYFDELSKKGLNIVADDFYRVLISIDDKNMSMAKYVQKASDEYSLKGIYRNNILEMQDKYYYLKVAGMVPRVWLDYWIVRAYKNGGYSLEDLMQIAKLNDIQLDTEIAKNPDMHKTVDKDLRFNPNEAINKRNILRFLSSLNNDKLQKMFETGLSAYELDNTQWDLLQEGIIDTDMFYKKENKTSQVVSIKRNAGRIIEFIITYESDISTDPKEIIISTNKMSIKSKK